MAAHAKSAMEGGIRKRKFAKRSTKNAVASPYSLHWPLLKDDHQEIIVNEIVNTLEDFESESFQREPTAQAENCKETENRLPEKQKGNTEKTMPRSSLVIGLNEVIRGLEKGNLVLVLVEKSIKPVSLLEHLIVLCATRNTAACALTSISETKIPKVLKVRRVAALGLKKLHAPVFDNLVDFIKSSAPPLHVPWLHTTEKNQGMSNEEGQNKNKKKQLFENTSEPLEKVQQQMSTAQPVTNTGTQLVGESTDNKILEKTREPENLKLQETGKATSQEELIVKKKKKRKRHSKQKTEKDSTPQLAYMKPCVKTYDTTPKDTLHKRKGRKCQ